jgi:hypothetical protein
MPQLWLLLLLLQSCVVSSTSSATDLGTVGEASSTSSATDLGTVGEECNMCDSGAKLKIYQEAGYICIINNEASLILSIYDDKDQYECAGNWRRISCGDVTDFYMPVLLPSMECDHIKGVWSGYCCKQSEKLFSYHLNHWTEEWGGDGNLYLSYNSDVKYELSEGTSEYIVQLVDANGTVAVEMNATDRQLCMSDDFVVFESLTGDILTSAKSYINDFRALPSETALNQFKLYPMSIAASDHGDVNKYSIGNHGNDSSEKKMVICKNLNPLRPGWKSDTTDPPVKILYTSRPIHRNAFNDYLIWSIDLCSNEDTWSCKLEMDDYCNLIGYEYDEASNPHFNAAVGTEFEGQARCWLEFNGKKLQFFQETFVLQDGAAVFSTNVVWETPDVDAEIAEDDLFIIIVKDKVRMYNKRVIDMCSQAGLDIPTEEWLLAREGQSCSAACKHLGLRCTDSILQDKIQNEDFEGTGTAFFDYFGLTMSGGCANPIFDVAGSEFSAEDVTVCGDTTPPKSGVFGQFACAKALTDLEVSIAPLTGSLETDCYHSRLIICEKNEATCRAADDTKASCSSSDGARACFCHDDLTLYEFKGYEYGETDPNHWMFNPVADGLYEITYQMQEYQVRLSSGFCDDTDAEEDCTLPFSSPDFSSVDDWCDTGRRRELCCAC